VEGEKKKKKENGIIEKNLLNELRGSSPLAKPDGAADKDHTQKGKDVQHVSKKRIAVLGHDTHACAGVLGVLGGMPPGAHSAVADFAVGDERRPRDRAGANRVDREHFVQNVPGGLPISAKEQNTGARVTETLQAARIDERLHPSRKGVVLGKPRRDANVQGSGPSADMVGKKKENEIIAFFYLLR